MVRIVATAQLLIPMAACLPVEPSGSAEYRFTEATPPMVVAFPSASASLSDADAVRLRRLGTMLPAQTVPELYAVGPLAGARIEVVRHVLDRPVVVHPASASTSEPIAAADRVLLVFPETAGIVPDACRGRGDFTAGGFWPGSETTRLRLLPAGCAAATSIQVQAAESGDLLGGRPLAAGASLPFADAIERYYRRNEATQSRTGGGPTEAAPISRASGDLTTDTGRLQPSSPPGAAATTSRSE